MNEIFKSVINFFNLPYEGIIEEYIEKVRHININGYSTDVDKNIILKKDNVIVIVELVLNSIVIITNDVSFQYYSFNSINNLFFKRISHIIHNKRNGFQKDERTTLNGFYSFKSSFWNFEKILI